MKQLSARDYPALNSLLFFEIWLTFVLDLCLYLNRFNYWLGAQQCRNLGVKLRDLLFQKIHMHQGFAAKRSKR
jgi:hypothetical protein